VRLKKEIIKLDATIMDVIKPSVFILELGNGHRMVAVEDGLRKEVESQVASHKIGDHVVEEVSPGDMATGRIIRP